MGFDNECIPNIQSLPGEYFCPVCRQLVYPNEAIQTQCTHLYCKPCLTYIVSTTRACPYDGYLVTEADSKPLIESNNSIAEAIGRIPVYCLYHRSGCTWQGSFSECTTHCTSCPYGSSPVVCNRCGTQIVHRQVQEHAQNCPGTQPLQQEGSQAPATSTAAVEPNQAVAPSATQAGGTTSQAAAAQTVPDQSQASTNVQSQPTSVVPTPEQWYQQYQQYYQQYPQYQQYHQQFVQYDQYQQHVQQYQPQLQTQPQGQPNAQSYLQPHGQPQAVPHLQQTHVQASAQPQVHTHAQPSAQPAVHQHSQANHPQAQPQTQLQPQPQAQSQLQSVSQQPQAQVQGQPQVQALGQPQPLPQSQPQPHGQPQPLHQAQPQLHSQQAQPQTQPHLLPQQQVLPQPQSQPHLPAHSHAHQQHPYPQPQVQAHQHAYPQPQPYGHVQQQLPPAQPQHQQFPHQQGHVHPYPQSNLHPQHQAQMQHPPSAHQSYPQTMPTPVPHPQHQQQAVPMHLHQQNSSVQQHSMQMPVQQQPLNQSLPHQMPVPNQFPSQQMRPQHPALQSHGPMQHQQQPAMTPLQAHHPHAPPQQQPHMAPPHQSAQPVPQSHAYPGVQPLPQQQAPMTQFHQRPQTHSQPPQLYPGLPPKTGNNYQQQAPPFPAQQPLRPHAPSVIQQHPPAQVPLNHSMPQSQATPPQQFPNAAQGAVSQHHVGMPVQNHGVKQQLLQQTPGGLLMGQDTRVPVRPLLSNAGQQLSPVQNMPRANPLRIPEQQQLSSGQHSSSQPASVAVSAGSQSGATLNQAIVAATLTLADMKQETMRDQASEPPALCVKSFPADAAGTSELDAKHDDGNECKVSKSLNNIDSLDVKEKENCDVTDKKMLSVEHTVSEASDSSPKLQKDAELHGHSDGNLNENASSKVNAPEELLEPSDNGKQPDTNGVIQADLNYDKDAQGEEKQEVPVDREDSENALDLIQAKDNDIYKEKDAEVSEKSQKSHEVNWNVKGSELNKLTSGPQPVEDAVGGSQAFPGRDRNGVLHQGMERNSFMASQQHAIGGPDKSMLQHHPQMMGPMHELKAPQPGFSERSLQPLSQQVPLDETRTMSHFACPGQSQMQANSFPQPAHPFPAPNDRQLQPFPLQHGPPYGERGMQVQRPPLLPMIPSGPNLDRRFLDTPHQVLVQGQFPPSQRPQGPGPFETFSQPGLQQVMPDYFQPPAKQQVLPHTSISNEPNNFSGPPPFGRVETSIPPHGHAFPPHAGGPKFIPRDPVAGLPMGPSHPGPFDSPGGMIPHGPIRGPDGQLGRPLPGAVEQADGLPSRRPGFVEGRQPDIRPPLSADRPLMGQTSGFQPGKGPAFPQALPDERFKSLPGEMFRPPLEEPFKPLPDEPFRSFPHDPSKQNIDRKEFDEDLKRFPRPGHLDGERGPQHDDYFSSSRHHGGPINFEHSRNMEGGHGFGRDSGLKVDAAGVPPRPFGSFPSSSDNFYRKADQVGSRSDFLRPVQEFGRPRVDGLPRSPGREFGGLSRRFVGGSPRLGSGGLSRSLDDFGGKEAHAIGERAKPYNLSEDISSFSGRKPPMGDFEGRFPPFPSSDLGFGAINEPFGPGSLPLHLRRDIAGHLRTGEPIGPRFGESPGLLNPHSHLRIGDPVGPDGLPSHLRFGEPFYSANLPPHLGVGESLRGEGGYYNPLLRQHEMDLLDHPRKRKPSSMGWCRICQIDCETVEGLDLHSQTREHQKMAMDMVMSIKQDTAKKQKLSSEDRAQDDTIRSKKSSFESRGNKH